MIVILPECSIVVIITKWYFNTRGTEWKLVNTIAILFYSGATRTPLQIAFTTELVATPQFGMNTKLKLVFESSTEMKTKWGDAGFILNGDRLKNFVKLTVLKRQN